LILMKTFRWVSVLRQVLGKYSVILWLQMFSSFFELLLVFFPLLFRLRLFFRFP
jgi:hypothetical protein